jgi:hypothetical protein
VPISTTACMGEYKAKILRREGHDTPLERVQRRCRSQGPPHANVNAIMLF